MSVRFCTWNTRVSRQSYSSRMTGGFQDGIRGRGEEVRLSVSRLEGVDGQTLTIQKSVLNVKPGKRVTECNLSLTL
jgi:hypothetical protein